MDDDPDEEDMDNENLDDERKNVTRGWCPRTMLEGWTMQRYFYMLRGGMSM